MYVLTSVIAFAFGCGTSADGEHLERKSSTASTARNTMKLTKIQTFDGAHKGFFSPDGTRLALMDQSHVEVIETATGRKLSLIDPRDSTFLGISFSPDGQVLATAFRSNGPARASLKVTLWNATSGRERLTLPVIDPDWRRAIDDLSFSPDGQFLASNIGGIARLWEVGTGEEALRFIPESGASDQQAERALLSPDGKWFAAYFISAADGAYHRVHLWNLATGHQKLFEPEIYLDWRFSADSRLLALTAVTNKGKPTERSVAEIWDVNTAKRLKAIEVPREWCGAYTVAFSPDSKL